MRRISTLFVALSCALAFASCAEKISPEVGREAMQEGAATIEILPVDGRIATKATGNVNTGASGNLATAEGNVKSLQIFVFNGDMLDGYAIATSGTSATISGTTSVDCTAGTRDIYCVCNAPSLSSITTKTALLAATSNLSTNSDANGYVMVGSLAGQAIAAGSNSKTVPVSLIASKIVLQGIENNLKAGGVMTVKRVYITNVAGTMNYGLTVYPNASGTWYNKGGYRSANGQNLGNRTQDINLTANVNSGEKYSTNHYFYAYPNNYDFAEYSATWAPKRTLLVVQIQYQGSLYDYPVDLGRSLEPGKMYVVTNLKLTNLGNPDDGNEGGADEENPVTTSTGIITVDVQDWTVVNLGELEY